jgi:hypothetical protein
MVVDVNYLDAVLNGIELNDSWKQCLGASESLSNIEKLNCLGSAIELRDRLLEAIQNATELDERQQCLAAFYLMVRSQWLFLNATPNATSEIQCRVSLFATLLKTIQPYVRPEDLSHAQNQLHPIDNQIIAPSSETPQNLEAQQALESQLSEAMASYKHVQIIVTSLERQLSTLYSEKQVLQAELGVSDPSGLVALLRGQHSVGLTLTETKHKSPKISSGRGATLNDAA